ncbi:MAG: ATP-dependent helicase UvrD/PcrA [Miltoncostaeaceae bacterium]|nr:ATP-dependent helicase UvrD/PcrA [Miltoncostaeaceae bacterium]
MLDDLTPQQRDAVAHASGPLLVVAGAGAGKTRVLCRRLAWLVDRGASPAEVLALTFSARAAEELRGRAEEALAVAHETLRVTTFHAYAMELARVHGVERGLLPATAPATDDDRSLLLLARLGGLELVEHDLRGDPAEVVSRFRDRINRCKDELVTAAAFRAHAEEALKRAGGNASAAKRARADLEFARVYERHDAWLAEAGLEDFGESLLRALALLRRHPDRLAAARAEARHILVDEFQDTNRAQAELLHLLADGAESLVVVGDDDQGIYRFRGASTKNIADFRARYPDAAEVRLELNHRSTQAILDAAGAVVAPLADRASKRLRALPEAAGPAPAFWIAPDEQGQARAVAEGIARLAGQGVPFEEQGVLMRAVRLEARPVIAALERAGIPHQVHGGVGLFERREVRAALAWLCALADPTDAPAHLRVAAELAPELPWPAAAEAVAEAAACGRTLTGALAEAARAAGATAAERLLGELGRAGAALAPDDLVREVLDRSGLRRGALALGGAEGASRLAGLGALERLAVDLCQRDRALDAVGLARRLAGLAAVGYRGDGGAPARRLGVQVMTIHQAKGLEFDAVHVIGLVASGLPGRDRSRIDIPDALLQESLPRGRDAHVAEARRLCYVAMTRARTHLVLCTFRAGERGSRQQPSPFWEEARRALGGPEPIEVGAAPEQGLLEAIGQRREAFEQRSLRAAAALAEGLPEDDAGLEAALEAARELVLARAAALRGPAPIAVPANPPARPARPGVTLTATDVLRYRSCPLAYRFARVDRVPERPAPARAIGVAAHAALEAHHRPGGEPGDGARLVARFASELSRRGVADLPEARQALERGREWLPRYHERTVRMRARTLAVERDFTMTIGPHRLRGRVDRIDRHAGGGDQLVDYKTGRQPGPGGEEEQDLVLRLYLAGAREAWGAPARGATLEYVLDGGTRQLHPEPAELALALEEARTVADGIAAGNFEPRPSWACRSCDFALICPAQDR